MYRQLTIEWPEADLNPSWSSTTASAASGATTITVPTNEGHYFNRFDLVKVPATGEVMLVTSVSASQIGVIRGYGTTATTIPSGATMVILGSAFEEGSSAGALITKSRRATRVFNFLQLMRKSVEVTNTMLNSELYGGDVRSRERRVKGIELMRDRNQVSILW